MRGVLSICLLVGIAAAARAQTITFSGLPGDTLTLTSTANGVATGSFQSAGGTAPAGGFSNAYFGSGSWTISTIDLSQGTDYDDIFLLNLKANTYEQWAEEGTGTGFALVGSGTVLVK